MKIHNPILKVSFCQRRKNGNDTFTHKGRLKGAAKRRDQTTGWPEIDKTGYDQRMIEGGRRYDEPGMEVRYAKIKRYKPVIFNGAF